MCDEWKTTVKADYIQLCITGSKGVERPVLGAEEPNGLEDRACEWRACVGFIHGAKLQLPFSHCCFDARFGRLRNRGQLQSSAVCVDYSLKNHFIRQCHA